MIRRHQIILSLILLVLACAMGIWCYAISSRPLVSVVMCVYNGAETGELDRSIPSILNQTWKDFEFIIVEDGSHDNSWDVLQKYAAQDKRIKLIKNDRNHGISYSRNTGNKAAKGKYIMIMDQDDRSLPDRILKQAAYMESYPWMDVVATPSTTKSPWLSVHNEDDIKWYLLFNNNFGHPNLMVKRQFLIKNKIRYNENYKCANDYDWLVQIFEKGGRFGLMYEALFEYAGAKLSKNSFCFKEAKDIMDRWTPKSELAQLAQQSKTENEAYQKWFCAVTRRLNQTKQFHHLFTMGYLEYMESEVCPKAENQ